MPVPLQTCQSHATGRIGRLARRLGLKAVALDLTYSKNSYSFDINEDAGFEQSK